MKRIRRMTPSEVDEWHAYIKAHGGFGLEFKASTARWATYRRTREDQNRPIEYIQPKPRRVVCVEDSKHVQS